VSTSYFISDLHLNASDSSEQQALATLCRLLQERRARCLFVLGDLFNFWVNTPEFTGRSYETTLRALYELAESGTQVHYFLGNRDFLFRSAQGSPPGFTVHPEGMIALLGGKRFYITHGDDLCRSEWGYRCMKPIIRCKCLEFVFCRLPSATQESIADGLAGASRKVLSMRAPSRGGISLRHCRKIIDQNGLEGIIHGHVHYNRLERLAATGRSATLLSLGAWEDGARPVWKLDEHCLAWSQEKLV
jgi:UDP-2,3-diacylglucosamine hydrolase